MSIFGFCGKYCCKCCKSSPQVQKQNDTVVTVDKAVDKKEKPFGYVDIYPGVRKADNTYNCPMLAIHLYRQSQLKAKINESERTVIVDNRNPVKTHEDSKQVKQKNKFDAEVDIMMLPLEDVIQMSAKLLIEKAEQSDIKEEIIPEYGPGGNCCDTCCDSIRKCCCSCRSEAKIAPSVTTKNIFLVNESNRNPTIEEIPLPLPKQEEPCCSPFRCWCCRVKKLIGLVKRKNTSGEREARRVIIVTLEYIKYSNLDTPSNTRLLSNGEQLAHYKEKFKLEEQLEFYLFMDTDLNASNFEVKKKEAEDFCRTVMQLKGMRNQYPSENELEQILNQSIKKTVGMVFREPTMLLR
ncbi:unnamed protein product [Rotaria magnacalcarata]|uniref:Uncharacterized protein n=8 Tax=Rotaria magnacalcarata TaxID=392030 RepID=A0A816NMU6_9BILA|nr:unnamed protein product [Rotaria magnacalcarata]CAF1316063.1 unnamed protein product [Rotaria magnacalcarata]CAF2037008.1 unnamed protein product [Rotaria magnacalcarata]CAF4513459.1 unnamed protein product [Rotaria magnacalcarata]